MPIYWKKNTAEANYTTIFYEDTLLVREEPAPLIEKILHTAYIDRAGISGFEEIRENLRNLMKYIPKAKLRYDTSFTDEILDMQRNDMHKFLKTVHIYDKQILNCQENCMKHIPKHIGIIPDGNRRWAERNGLKKEEGYAYGLDSGLRLLRAAQEQGIQELTYYGFTVDNCKRPKEQVIAFSKACIEAVKMIEQENAELYVIGNTNSSCFPEELLPYTGSRRHSDCGKGTVKVNFLVNYGWEWDMKNGWASSEIPRIDMVIRWGGMCRLSGFLPIQTVYSDFYIVKELWPDFQEKQFTNALQWYQEQDITLGG